MDLRVYCEKYLLNMLISNGETINNCLLAGELVRKVGPSSFLFQYHLVTQINFQNLTMPAGTQWVFVGNNCRRAALRGVPEPVLQLTRDQHAYVAGLESGLHS